MNFRPLRDMILVRPISLPLSTTLIVPNKDEPNSGVIHAKGPRADSVQVGDEIRFGTTENYLKYPRVKLGAEEFLLLSEKDVCFVC